MPPLLGFAYGAAGICHALLRLHGATGEAEPRQAAREGLEFVRGLYSPAHGRWWDPRALLEARHRLRRGTWTDFWYGGRMDDLEPLAPDEQPAAGAVAAGPAAAGPADGQRLPRLWCHGSSGILLGKMATLDLDGGAEVRQEIADGLEDLCRYAADEDAPGETDDLCCGRLGPAEALLYAHGRLGDARYLAAARALVARVWLRRRRAGRYAVSAARGRDLFAPHLLHGLAGIGYSYLRLAMPRDLPCLVLLE
jgi:lantibiotic modifying enzyme